MHNPPSSFSRLRDFLRVLCVLCGSIAFPNEYNAAMPANGVADAKLPALPVTLEDVLAARERIRDVIYHSPCPYSLTLSRMCGRGGGGCDIYCKLDHLQMTGSFKE